jgi:hypothetical protein
MQHSCCTSIICTLCEDYYNAALQKWQLIVVFVAAIYQGHKYTHKHTYVLLYICMYVYMLLVHFSVSASYGNVAGNNLMMVPLVLSSK